MALCIQVKVERRELLTGELAAGTSEPFVRPVGVPQVGGQPLLVAQVRKAVAAARFGVGGVQSQVSSKDLAVRAQVCPTQRAFKAAIKKKNFVNKSQEETLITTQRVGGAALTLL
jgi:hypothetical protein